MIPVVIITSGHRPQIRSLVGELRQQRVVAGVDIHIVLHRLTGVTDRAYKDLKSSVNGLARVWSAERILAASVGNHDRQRVWSDEFPVATARNAALALTRTIDSNEAILLDDDVSGLAGFLADVIAIRRSRVQTHQPLILGARLTGASSADRLSRLIGQLRGTESNHYPIADTHIPVEFVSGGCAYISLHPAALLPVPLQYNEFWAWCQVMRSMAGCAILLTPTYVFHSPATVPMKGIEELASELEGIHLLKVLRAMHNATREKKVSQSLDALIAGDRFSPTRRLEHIQGALAEYPQGLVQSAALAVGIDPPCIDFARLRSLLASRLSAERVAQHVRQQLAAQPLQVNGQTTVSRLQ